MSLERGSDLRAPERVELMTYATHERPAALLFPDGQRALQSLARLLDPASTLEDHCEVLVAPALEPDVVRLRLRGNNGGTSPLLGLCEFADPSEEEGLNRRDER